MHCARSDAIASRLTPTGPDVGHKFREHYKTNVGAGLLAKAVCQATVFFDCATAFASKPAPTGGCAHHKSCGVSRRAFI